MNPITTLLCRLLRCCPRPVPFVLRFHAGAPSFIQGDNLMARITTEQRVKITVAPKTQAGHDANIDGAIAFESSDASVAAVEPIDGNSAYVVAQGKGAAQISAKFDADLGEGVRTIELSGAVEVVDAEAVSGELTFGEPELNPNA